MKHSKGTCVSIGIAALTFADKKLSPSISATFSVKMSSKKRFKFVACVSGEVGG
jgi:hypothetical protein